MAMIKNLIVASVSCLVCVNTYAATLTQEEIKTRLKGLTKIDYGIWAYNEIAPLKNSHWIKQPKLFKSAVTVIGDAISKILVNSDEFELDKDENPKELITFKANPEGYDRSNWNAFICYNFINEVVKASINRRININVDKIFDDIQNKALAFYEDKNIVNLKGQLETSISDIKEYNDVLDLSTFLKLFSELKSNIKNGKDHTSCIVEPTKRNLEGIKLKDVKSGKIKIIGAGEFIKLEYKDYSRNWWIRKAYGLNYPMAGEFLNTNNKFFLELAFDKTKKVWRTSEIKPFKKIKYIQPDEQEEVTNVLYGNEHLHLKKTIEKISKYMAECEDASDAAKAAVEKIINDNEQRKKKKRKN